MSRLAGLFVFLFVVASGAKELRVLNLNMWAVELSVPEFIAKSPSVELEDRLRRLPSEVASIAPDVIVFQEVWKEKRVTQISEMLAKIGYTYHVAKSSNHGLLLDGGNGLLIVSKLPLSPDVVSMSFSSSTKWDESFLICRKGALKTQVEVEPGTWIDLYATHLGSSDIELVDGKPVAFNQNQLDAQAEQTRELIKFIRETRKRPSMMLAADLNTNPFDFHRGLYDSASTSVVYHLLTCTADGCASLNDTFSVLQPRPSSFETYDTVHNTYANKADFGKEPPGRIDYIFTSGPALVTKNLVLTFKERPLSDHYGLMATFDVH